MKWKEREGLNMESRPRLNIQRTPLQNWINIISVFIIGGSAIYLLVNYAKLPEQIPMHFNYIGEVDYRGPKRKHLHTFRNKYLNLCTEYKNSTNTT